MTKRPRWIPTKYEGVQRHPMEPKTFRVRARLTDDLGRRREVDRILHDATLRTAILARIALSESCRKSSQQMILPGLDLGRENPGRPERMRLAAFAERWIALKAPHQRRGTSRMYSGVIDRHVLPVLGDAWIDSIAQVHVQKLVNLWMAGGCREPDDPGAGHTAETIRLWYRIFRAMMRDAVDELGLPRDPSRRIHLPAAPGCRRQKRALTLDELRALLHWYREYAPRYYALVVLMAATGLRWTHASSIRWSDIDDAGVLHVQRARDQGPKGAVSAPLAKNKRAPESIALTPEIMAMLRAHDAEYGATRTATLVPGAPGAASSAYVFQQIRGAKMASSSTWSQVWHRAITALGIPLGAHVGPHALRRTFVDLLRPAGVHAQIGRLLTAHATEAQFDGYASAGAAEVDDAFARVAAMVVGEGRQTSDPLAPQGFSAPAPAAPSRSAERVIPANCATRAPGRNAK